MTAKTTDEWINDLMELVGFDEEVMLYRWSRDPKLKWVLHVGNSSQVPLGEVDGDNVFNGESVHDVVIQAINYFSLSQSTDHCC
jgi:hypothetical protein